MPTFLVLIYGSETAWDSMTSQEEELSASRHAAFQQAAGDRLLGGHEVDRTAGVVSVRADAAGRIERVDGPLDRGDRVLGGYYLLRAADRQSALELVVVLREVEVAHSGVEVRQVLHG